MCVHPMMCLSRHPKYADALESLFRGAAGLSSAAAAYARKDLLVMLALEVFAEPLNPAGGLGVRANAGAAGLGGAMAVVH